MRALLPLPLVLLSSTAVFGQTPITIFDNATPQIPVVTDDTVPVTLGVKFFSTVQGAISGIRFYRGHHNSNGYTVKLFTAGGTLLASATASRDTCSVPCWEQINFAAPVSIQTNITYIAAYYTSNGRYPDDQYALTDGAESGPLYAVMSNGAAGNGVYTYSTGFPNQSWRDSNYWVDVSFIAIAPTLLLSVNPANPSIPSSTAPGTVVATVTATWSDGSPFTGTYGFGNPYNNASGQFALQGNEILVGPNGIAGDGGTTQYISVVASQ